MTLEVVQFVQRGEKWKANRLGYAKRNDKGQLNVYLDVMPIPQVRNGETSVSLVIQERQQRDDSREGYSNASQGGAPAGGYDDGGDIPFAPWVL